MKQIFALIFFGIAIFLCGLGIGLLCGETNTNNKARDLAREKFTDAISWAISEKILIVNSNRVNELGLRRPEKIPEN